MLKSMNDINPSPLPPSTHSLLESLRMSSCIRLSRYHLEIHPLRETRIYISERGRISIEMHLPSLLTFEQQVIAWIWPLSQLLFLLLDGWNMQLIVHWILFPLHGQHHESNLLLSLASTLHQLSHSV